MGKYRRRVFRLLEWIAFGLRIRPLLRRTCSRLNFSSRQKKNILLYATVFPFSPCYCTVYSSLDLHWKKCLG